MSNRENDNNRKSYQAFLCKKIEKNPYPDLPKRVGGDIEKQTDKFGSYSAESEPFGFLQQIIATFGS
ncbi:hypothetical protein EZV62_003315 [Acer yangbiense]|uniref:Uncharacterized protein n=1 Tax=Acer yangbiense TaxID=1000413 RepID=A0A5C7IGC8_9ROSI|nr:hypothetical protein EZV62_003315 [Acer yangbiense]